MLALPSKKWRTFNSFYKRKGTAKDPKRPLRSKSYIILHQAKDELICIFDDATNVHPTKFVFQKWKLKRPFTLRHLPFKVGGFKISSLPQFSVKRFPNETSSLPYRLLWIRKGNTMVLMLGQTLGYFLEDSMSTIYRFLVLSAFLSIFWFKLY